MKQQDRIARQLNAILASPQFAASRRMQRFLEFVVNQTAGGAAGEIKEYTIGVEVFDRRQDYDPRIDSIVRVEARRLRRKLREYYDGPGKQDEIRVSLPEGSYVPCFEGLEEEQPSAPLPIPKVEGVRIAVLPLETIPASEDARMLADALLDDLLGALAKIPSLFVVTRSAALRFRDPQRDLKKIAGELGVDWILEGALRRSGGLWRLSALLAECSTSFARWSESYTAGPAEVQSLHRQVAKEVAVHLGIALPEPAVQDAAAGVVPFRHLLGARHLMLQMTPRSLDLAAQAFKRALSGDPQLAPAWAGYAGTLLLRGLFGDTAPTMVEVDVCGALERALLLSPELSQAHAWRGFFRATYCWNWDAAEEDFLRALNLNPHLAMARVWLAGTVLGPLGRFNEALDQMALARKQDPASPILHSLEGLLLTFAGDVDGGLKLLATARALSQTHYAAHHITARVLAAKGDYEQALHHLEMARPRAGSDPRNLALIAAMQAWMGRTEEALEIQSSLEKVRQQDYVSAYDMAIMALGLAQRNSAASYLMQALAEHEPWLIYLRQDSLLGKLKGTPQYGEAERMMFSEPSA